MEDASLLSHAETISLGDAELTLHSHFLGSGHSRWLFDFLLRSTPWRQDEIRMYGRLLPVPRLQAWYGSAEAAYGYSGLHLSPLPYTPVLARLQQLLEQRTGQRYNSVLLNQYRNGRDSVAWHSDNEPQLGAEPVIASLSLGATRRFELRHRSCKDRGKRILDLEDDTLLVMGAGVQRHWQHGIPKQPACAGIRINLTFRLIHPVASCTHTHPEPSARNSS